MEPIESLAHRVRATFSDAKVEIGEPLHSDGDWHLDIGRGDYSLVVEWRADRGFGVSTPTGNAYGPGPDEVYRDFDAIWDRVNALLVHRLKTQVHETQLPALRIECGLSQVELAARLQIQQSAVSKLEHRDDMLVSTLSSVVSALGGTLEIRALFPDGVVRVLKLSAGITGH